MTTPNCPRCGGRYQEGFILDRADKSRATASWVEGAPSGPFGPGSSSRTGRATPSSPTAASSADSWSPMRRKLELVAGLALASLPGALQAQAPATGIYRIYQGAARGCDGELPAPGGHSRTGGRGSGREPPGQQPDDLCPWWGTDGFRMTVSNAAGDSVRGSYRVTVAGDTLHITSQFGSTAQTLVRTGRALLVLPPQSIFSFVELGRRTGAAIRRPCCSSPAPIPCCRRWSGSGAIQPRSASPDSRSCSVGAAAPTRNSLFRSSGSAPCWPGYMIPSRRSPGCAGPRLAPAPPPARRGRRRRCGCPPAPRRTPSPLPAPSPGPAPIVPFPAAVTITGSGMQTRDSDLWPLLRGYRIFGQVAERLSAAGIAVLRCDDRTAGGSGGRADSRHHGGSRGGHPGPAPLAARPERH